MSLSARSLQRREDPNFAATTSVRIFKTTCQLPDKPTQEKA